nr:NfeD family protein [Maliibacterium massiliense]
MERLSLGFRCKARISIKGDLTMWAYFMAFSWAAALMLIVGIALIIIEMFIPGFGVPGISGSILIVAGIFVQAKTVEEGLIILLVVAAILGIALMLILHSAQKGKLSKSSIVLSAAINESSVDPTGDLHFFLDKEGVVLTPLRPAGTADFDGVRLDVLAESAFVEANTPVRVIRVEGSRIVVRPIKP